MSDTQYEQITALSPDLLARRWPTKDAARVWLGRRGVKPNQQKQFLGCILRASMDGSYILDPITEEACALASDDRAERTEQYAGALAGGPLVEPHPEVEPVTEIAIGDGVIAAAEAWKEIETAAAEIDWAAVSADAANVRLADDPSRLTPETVEQSAQQAEVEAPDFAKEPAMSKPAKAAKVAKAEKPVAQPAVDPTNGLLIKDAILSVEGLPASSRALGYARDLCRKLKFPIAVRDAAGDVVFTVTREMLAEEKAQARDASKAKRAADRKPRESKTEPEGKRAAVVKLCMRPQGATVKELVKLTGWEKAPWRWTLGSNKNGTGFCDRYGYEFSQSTRDGAVCYHLSQRA